MPTKITGQPTSPEVLQTLADEGKPVLLAFSRGKDSLAAWLAMREYDIEVVPAYMYGVPGLRFVQESLDYYEQFFQTRIKQYPHPSLLRQINSMVFQPPERLAIIEAAMLPEPDYDLIWDLISEDLGQVGAWRADGVRASDSIMRRTAFVRYGVMKPKSRKVSPIADFLKREVFEIIERHGCQLPPDYEWFDRSLDGLDYRFLAPLKEHAPDDYERTLEWFPLADLEIFRKTVEAV